MRADEVWLGTIELADLRNIREARLELSPGLNVLVGDNAQGKTSLLEAVGLLARGRSFRTEQTATVIRRGASCLHVQGTTDAGHTLAIQVQPGHRELRLDGSPVGIGAYQGRLEVAVYSTDRLRVIHGPMRERRQFLDRGASALWPAYRHLLRDYERVVQQRNAALEQGGRDLGAWDDRLLEEGAGLRLRRARYAGRLQQHLRAGFQPSGERFDLVLPAGPLPAEEGAYREALQAEMAARRRDEHRQRRSLAGPHRDAVGLTIDGEEAALFASAGQARSLLLALTLAVLAVYREERSTSAVALLDDLDSELDDGRATALCRELAAQGQTLVTTAQPGWARRLVASEGGRLFEVQAGQVRAA